MTSSNSHFVKKLESQTIGLWFPGNKETILEWVDQKVKQAAEEPLPMDTRPTVLRLCQRGSHLLNRIIVMSTELFEVDAMGFIGFPINAVLGINKATLDGSLRGFTDIFDYLNPNDTLYLGFESWDQFLTRKFKPNITRVERPTKSHILNNSCESAPLQYKQNVKASGFFLLKA
ncbi:hypothetical protein ACJA88_014883 [Fusarium oxysporum]